MSFRISKSKSDSFSIYSDISDQSFGTPRSVRYSPINTKNGKTEWINASGKISPSDSWSWRSKSRLNSETSSFYSEKTEITLASNTSRTTGSSQKKYPSIQSQIKDWASSDGSDEDKISEYSLKSTIFDNPKFQRTNFINFAGYLSKYRRLNLLEWYLNNKIPSLIASMIEEEEKKNKEESIPKNTNISYISDKNANFVRDSLKAYSPINQAIWPTKDTVYTPQVISDIKSIISLLASHNFSYISKKQRKDGSEYEESVIDALYDEDNPIPIEFKNEIFDFLMYEFDNDDFWIHPFKVKVNKICKKLTDIDKKTIDLIYMIGMRCTKTAVEDNFRGLVSSEKAVEIKGDSLNNLRMNIFELWLSPPPISQSIYSRFYSDPRTKLETKPLNIADYIVSDGKRVVDERVSKLEYDPKLTESDLVTFKSKEKTSHYKNYFLLLGMLYSRGFYKSKIIELIDSILDEKDGPFLVMTSIIHFLLGGRIDLNTMDLQARNFFAKFIKTIYNFETKKGINDFGIFESNLVFRFLNYKGDPKIIWNNLLIPEIQIKYTGKVTPIIKFISSADDYTNTQEKIQDQSKIQNEIKGLKTILSTNNEIQELEAVFDQMTIDDLESDDEFEDDEIEFEINDMIEPNEELVEAFVRFADFGEQEDAIDFINRKLTKLSKTEPNQELIIAIISSLNLRQKPNHIEKIKNFINQTTSPESFLITISEVMNTQSIVQSFKNDHDFPNIEKIVRQIIGN